MTVKIEQLSKEVLQKKIDNLQEERKRTAEMLSKYEAEMAERNRRVLLGVPQEGLFFVDTNSNVDKRYGLFSLAYVNYNCFLSKESAAKHSEMLLSWRKALVDAANCEPIDIEVLKPLLRKGWVAMSANRQWRWYSEKPFRDINALYGVWSFFDGTSVQNLNAFNIKPVADWTKSLTECCL